MNLQVLLATRRGLWRCPLKEGDTPGGADFHGDTPGGEDFHGDTPGGADFHQAAPKSAEVYERAPRPGDFHQAAPALEITALASSGRSTIPAALSRRGDVLLWDAGAFGFREGASLPFDEEVEWEVLSKRGDGAFLAGACPVEIASYDPSRDRWARQLSGESSAIPFPIRSQWQGLEAPYEPRITAILSQGEKTWASVSVGGLLRRGRGGWEAVEIEGIPHDLRDLSWAFDRLWLASGRGLFSWRPPGTGRGRPASGTDQVPPSPGTDRVPPPPGTDQIPPSPRTDRVPPPPGIALDHPASGPGFTPPPRRCPFPVEASFTAALRAGAPGLAVAAAPGPPATWRGPDGARMSLWLVTAADAAPRRLAGPFHGSILALDFLGEELLAGTSDGQLWRIPLSGAETGGPWIEDLPPINDLMVIDLPAG